MIKIKTSLLACWLALLQTACHGQTFKEWFQQNSTQKQYLKEQIAHLKLYLELTEQGYQIAREGLGLIHQIQSSELKLHKDRFDSLRIVKSAITSLSRLEHITDLHGRINEICQQLPAEIEGCQALDAARKLQMLTALDRLYDDGQVLIGGLFMVIRHQQLAMTDQQRIRRIEQLYQEFEGCYLSAQQLRRDLAQVCGAGAAEQQDIENRLILRGIK